MKWSTLLITAVAVFTWVSAPALAQDSANRVLLGPDRVYDSAALLQDVAEQSEPDLQVEPNLLYRLRIEAHYHLGWCQLKQGQLVEARRTWQDVLASPLANQPTDQASRERLAEAAFHLAATYGAPEPPSDEDLDLALAACDAFIDRHPDHALASQAHFQAITGLMHRGRFRAATQRIAAYLAEARYADREETPQIRYLLGSCHARQQAFAKAITAWRE